MTIKTSPVKHHAREKYVLMNKSNWSNVTASLLLCLLCLFVPSIFSLSQAGLFSLEKSPDLGQLSQFNASELCTVANNTRQYIEKQSDDVFAVHAGQENYQGFTLARVKDTLAFICQTDQADVLAKRSSRLHDANFVKDNFDFVRWSPDKKTADEIAQTSTNARKSAMLNQIPDDQIFLTKYYTKLLNGSSVKTAEFDQALYALPYDETSLSLTQAAKKSAYLTRFRFTRQQIINGVLEQQNLAKPLIWITEEALHDVLLQGTGVIKVAGEIRYFNVHRNNSRAYDYSIGKREQARYWYFAQVPGIMGYGKTLQQKISLKAQVSFAGNVADLGLGKLILVSYQQDNQKISRLGVLADQGGAFDNNLFQLDLLVDSYRGWSDYHKANKHMPDYAQAWLLLVKQ